MSKLCIINSRQAWQFALVPLEIKGSELYLLSTTEFAPRAIRFVRRVLRLQPCVQLVSEHVLRERLIQEFGFDGSIAQCMRPGAARLPMKNKTENGNSRI